MTKRVHIKIYGLVQGVSLRYYTKEKAEKLDLSGFIRNNLDSTVELEAEGDEKTLQKLIDFIKIGPPLAQIDDLEIHYIELKNTKGFIVE